MRELPADSDEVLQKLPPRPRQWQPGDRVRVRGACWLVEGGRGFVGCELVRLLGTGPGNRGRRLSLLCPFDRPRAIESGRRVHRVTYGRWLRALETMSFAATPFGRLWTMAAANLDIHGWQMEPALAMLNGIATRVLLADAVGLGKTIQAGLIVSELRARDRAARTLIVTPAGLRDQWRAELHERFGIDVVVVDADVVRRTVSQLAAGTNPWATWPVIVTSLDFVKRPEVVRALDSLVWDLLVVDEAHGCALAPERSEAVRRLAGRSRRVVLATATPHPGDDSAFAALCGIGASGADDRVVMFRRTRADVGLRDARRVHLLRVRSSPREQRVLTLLARYTGTVWATPGASRDARLAMVVLRKRALSSVASLLRSLERRSAALLNETSPGTQLALPFPGQADITDQNPEDDEPVGPLAAPAMDSKREREWLHRLLAAARQAAGCESKLRRLLRLVACAREPAIVFTEYRDTARWLAMALQPVGPVVLLHGGLSRRERQDAEREFTAGRAQVLVATDAAGEGLNLHQRCRLVINLELPWNPMRLEQRVGRVDRIGQQRQPHAIHLVARSSDEERIVERLVVRQERARRSVGKVGDAIGDRHAVAEASCTEEHVTASVMAGGSVRGMRATASGAGTELPPYRTAALGQLAAEEEARVRGVRHVCRSGAPAAFEFEGRLALAAEMPRRRVRRMATFGRCVAPGLYCVFLCRITNGQGDVLEEVPVCVHIPRRASHALVDSAIRRLASHLPLSVRTLIEARATQAFNGVSQAYFRTVESALARERFIAAAGAAPSPLLQPGLFDNRASKARVASNQATEMRERDRIAGAPPDNDGCRPVILAMPELALALLVPDPAQQDEQQCSPA